MTDDVLRAQAEQAWADWWTGRALGVVGSRQAFLAGYEARAAQERADMDTIHKAAELLRLKHPEAPGAPASRETPR